MKQHTNTQCDIRGSRLSLEPFSYVKSLKTFKPMNEFFDLLGRDMFARIFIFCEVWASFILGYILGRKS